MTAVLGVTKGSFYHHFKNIDAFKAALLEAWEQDSLEIIREITKDEISPDILHKLIAEFEKRSPKPEIRIRAWAVTDKAACESIERLDVERIAFLTKVLTPVFGAGNRASAFAAVFYAVIIGSLSMHPPLSIDRIKELGRTLFQMSGVLPRGDEPSAH